MSKGYWVSAHRNLPDSDKYEAYAKLAVPAIEQNGGRILVRAITETAVENGLTGFRTVVIEFDSYEKAVAAYHSENLIGSYRFFITIEFYDHCSETR